MNSSLFRGGIFGAWRSLERQNFMRKLLFEFYFLCSVAAS